MDIREVGSFLFLSIGFYFLTPYTVWFIELICIEELIGIVTIVLNAIIAAAMIKLYFSLFQSKPEKEEKVTKK
jgi:hypothetical protein